MTQQLSRAVAAVGTAGSDFQNMLGGNGGTQVDAVLYLVSEGEKSQIFSAFSLAKSMAQTPFRVMSNLFASFVS